MKTVEPKAVMNAGSKPLSTAGDDAYLDTLTVDRAQEGFRSGAFAAESLVRACLQRIERFNGHYNAVIALNLHAVDEARRIDRRRGAGERLGPLAGLPTTGGWSALCAKRGGIDLLPERGHSAALQ